MPRTLDGVVIPSQGADVRLLAALEEVPDGEGGVGSAGHQGDQPLALLVPGGSIRSSLLPSASVYPCPSVQTPSMACEAPRVCTPMRAGSGARAPASTRTRRGSVSMSE